MLKKTIIVALLLSISETVFCWGFFGHQKINNYAVFLLPPEMMAFYKPRIDYITKHAVDPDKRRYLVAEEGPRHYIDIDYYGHYPFTELPRKWDSAVAKYTLDTINSYGIVPWHVQIMLSRLTKAFKEKDEQRILKLSAEIGHYIADAHVPLHASMNHNGQLTNQQGIHGFWESRIPELLADKDWDFFVGKAMYIDNPGDFIWKRVLESAAAADTVLRAEKELSQTISEDQKFAFEQRNNVLVKQYSSLYTKAYDRLLNGMVERRMRDAIFAVASFWYTAWVNAGQPDLQTLSTSTTSEEQNLPFDTLNLEWQNKPVKGRSCE
jgi:hypothetical protein